MYNRMRLFAVLVTTVLPSLATLFLIGALQGPVAASPRACDPILYVDHDGGCNGATPCFTTVQEAVDAACTGREIRVREGTYTGVQVRNSVTQVVYISKSVTIRGGYSLSNWSTPNPDTQPTILDAQGQGRVFYILGPSTGAHITPTLQGLRLTNGRITNADGGGLYAEYANLVISGCHVYSNAASGPGRDGGGLYLYQGNSISLTGNYVYSNTTSHSGGGICLSASYDAVLVGNHIYSNTAVVWAGGGLQANGSDRIELTDNHIHHNMGVTAGGAWFSHCDDASLIGNHVHDNVAVDQDGGGVYLQYGGNLTLADNLVHNNHALSSWSDGGGVVVLDSPDASLTGNHIYSNTAGRSGGGIIFDDCINASLTRNQVYGNIGTYFGGGIEISGGSNTEVRDNEIYDNSGPIYGGGVYVSGSPYISVEGNRVHDNQSDNRGAGIFLSSNSDHSTLANNLVHNNSTGNFGGGLYVGSSDDVNMIANQIHDNSSGAYGGGVYALVCQQLSIENNMVVDNQLLGGDDGAGIYVQRTNGTLFHSTIANNTGGNGQGIYATLTSSLQLANTIIVSHEIGIETGLASTASLDYTLWGAPGSNISDTLGAGIVTSNDMWADPLFEAPGNGDYHITFGSPAKDSGTNVGVATDVDGDSRVVNSPPDIGADEYACHVRLNDDPTPYPSVQAAIDTATQGDTVRVAGACRSVERNASEWQVAYIAKNLTLRGGYSTDFASWDPEQYPTTLDAGGRGRLVYLYGDITSQLQALRLVNGVDFFGGGIVINGGSAVISDCHILDNLATLYGGGLYVAAPDAVTLVNTVVADNRVSREDGKGAGIMAIVAPMTMLHTTLARNTGGDGSGVAMISSTAAFSNTILVDHSVGITTITPDSYVWLEATLWGSGEWANDLDWIGVGTVSPGTNNYWLEPVFVDPDSGNYHLASDSPAIDLGVATGVSTDIDGHSRPVGPGPDLGADEARLRAFLPVLLRSY